jgi:hypothetical protein
MGKRLAKSKPTWADVKTNLASFDRAALLGLLQDLYQADEANQAFLHARFGLGEDPLQPYKKTIDGWLWPDVFRGQQASVSKAKRAITRYTKALSDPVGLAELLVFYCEQATGFCQDVDHRDTAYLDALVRTFEQALKATGNLTGKVQNGFLTRLERVRNIGHNLGYGVGDHMDVLFAELVLPFQAQGRWWKDEETVDTRGHKPSLMQRTRNASSGSER